MALAFPASTGGFLTVASYSSEHKSAHQQIRAPLDFSREFLSRSNIWTASRNGTHSSRESSSCQYVPRCGPSASSVAGTAPTTSSDSVSAATVVLGVDFGGTRIKAAPVDISTGRLVKERVRIPTPSPATPQAVAHVVKQLQQEFQVGWESQFHLFCAMFAV